MWKKLRSHILSKTIFLFIINIMCLLLIISVSNNLFGTKERYCTEEDILYLFDNDLKTRPEDELHYMPVKHIPKNPLLVIFTTFKATSEHHLLAHRLTISNWASFGEVVKPILFTNVSDKISDLIKTAKTKGWDVLPVLSSNKYGTPHLKSMYEEIYRRYNASFYGYFNGDLLLTDNILESLQFVKSIPKLFNNVMLVGRRTDILLCPVFKSNKLNKSFNAYMSTFEKHFSKSNLPKLAARGELRETCALDYFIFSKTNSTFDWSRVADVVVGRRGYDQYLVVMAKKFDVNTIDLSDTVLMTHLSKPGTRDTGLVNEDKDYNVNLIGKHFRYDDGLTTSTHYYLRKDDLTFNITMEKRLVIDKHCS